ncbi:MAG: hypothetical protein ACRDJ4_05130 [Actinomycetota bacterium]
MRGRGRKSEELLDPTSERSREASSIARGLITARVASQERGAERAAWLEAARWALDATKRDPTLLLPILLSLSAVAGMTVKVVAQATGVGPEQVMHQLALEFERSGMAW